MDTMTYNDNNKYTIKVRCLDKLVSEHDKQIKKELIEKAVEWLDSIMCQLSPEDPILACNFTDFDELVNDFKNYMKE